MERLTDGELMAHTEGGRVYTDFIIYMKKDREATVAQQHAIAASLFTAFWSKILEGLEELRKRNFYLRQKEHARKNLELHFCIHTLLWTCIPIRDENIGGVMPYDDYTYRKNGGRWFAMGNRYSIPPKLQPPKHSINGEAGNYIRNFCGAKSLELRKYDTSLGGYPNNLFHNDYVQRLYEIYKGVSPEESAVGAYVLESVDTLAKQGILTNSNGIALDFPSSPPQRIGVYLLYGSNPCGKETAAAPISPRICPSAQAFVKRSGMDAVHVLRFSIADGGDLSSH